MKNKVITAVNVVIINKENKVLIAKRKPTQPMPNKWEFPGGKIEANETLEECGVREIKEELALDVKIDLYLGIEELTFDKKRFDLHFYTAHKIDENQKLKLNEHTQSQWVNVSDLKNYDFPAIDLACIKILKQELK